MLRSSLVVTLLSIVSSLVSFVNQLIIAKLFGTTMHMDAYLISVSIPALVSGALTAVLSFSLVPALITQKAETNKYSLFSGFTLLCIAGFSSMFILIGYITAPRLIAILGISLPNEVQVEAIRMTRISWFAGGFTLIAGHLSAMHNASKRFFLPVLSNMLPFLAMIGFGIMFGRVWGPLAIVWGMLTGSILAVLFLLQHTLPDLSITKKSFNLWKEAVSYFSQMPLVMMAMLAFTVYQSIDAYWAPKLGSGNLAYLGYCQRLLIALGSLVIAGPSVVLVPRLAEAFTQGRHQDFLNDMGRTVRTILAFGAPLALIISLLSVPIIELLFQRGAFDSEATQGVAAILPLMMTGMVAMICVVMIFRAFFASRLVRPAAILGVLSTALYFIFSGLFSNIAGVKGIALSYALSWWIIFSLCLWILWENDLKMLLSKENATFVLHLALTLVVTGIITYFGATLFIKPLKGVGLIGLSFRLLMPLGLAVLSFYLVSVRLFHMPDVKLVILSFENKFIRQNHQVTS